MISEFCSGAFSKDYKREHFIWSNYLEIVEERI